MGRPHPFRPDSQTAAGLAPGRPHPAKVVTIWAHHGPYHLDRIAALEASGYRVVAFSIAGSSRDYPFFDCRPPRHEVINPCQLHEVNPLISFWRTIRLLLRHRPRLVLACGYERPETAAAILYARLLSPEALVFCMVENQRDDRPRSLLIESVKRLYLRCFQGFLAGGRTHLDYLRQLGVQDGLVRLGYDCVGNDRLAALAEHARRAGVRPVPFDDYVLCVSRLLERKNVPFLVRAYSRYREALAPGERPWHLVVCGDGPDRRTVEEAVREAKLEGDVLLAGEVRDPSLMVAYYAFCRVFVLPSRASEPWGLVVNEAMAAGRPVLVSRRCGCAGELVEEGRNGFTFDPEDERHLAELLLWAHRHRDRLEEMGQASRLIVDRFSPATFAMGVRELEVRSLGALAQL